MHLTRLTRALLLVGLVSLPTARAQAASCVVNPQDLSLGRYDPLSDLPQDAVGSVTVRCDAAVAFVVALGPGNGSYAARKMIGGGQVLLYNLFLDPNHLTVWGDGSGGSGSVSRSSTGEVLPIYGRAPGGQSQLKPGMYSDTITVTVTY